MYMTHFTVIKYHYKSIITEGYRCDVLGCDGMKSGDMVSPSMTERTQSKYFAKLE